MLNEQEFIQKALRLDHKGYPQYKSLKGRYSFGDFTLEIAHVQSDPFASPSRIAIHVDRPGFPKSYYETKIRRTFLEDFLLRQFESILKTLQGKGGNKKTGEISVSKPGAEVLERSACSIHPKTGALRFLLHASFPAAGRSILAKEFTRLMTQVLALCVRQSFFYFDWSLQEKENLRQSIELADDWQAIQEYLIENKLVGFINNGAVLPRASGISSKPMADAIPFESPKSLEVEINVPHKGKISGMAIPEGITLICGGGYHGKTTVLESLESGVYPHVLEDGREYVACRPDAFKIRAEDGRIIHHDDISSFIRDLPFGKSTQDFVSSDASGSTSQAANVVEALESGSKLLLMDEDTSATNFMIRDELMAEVVQTSSEPIIPFTSRIQDLKREGISIILAVGSSGAYFSNADTILQMDQYYPVDITGFVRKKLEKYPMTLQEGYAPMRTARKRMFKGSKGTRQEKVKVKTTGLDTIFIAKEPIDVRYLEQIKDPEQVKALGAIVLYAARNYRHEKISMEEMLDQIEEMIDKNTLSFVGKGDLARPRRQEISGVLNRWRSAEFEQIQPEELQPDVVIEVDEE